MNISENWKKLQEQRLERPIDGELKKGEQSRHPVEKLKRNYFIKTIMMAVFVACFAGLSFYFDQSMIRIALTILVAAYVIFLAASYSMYKGIRLDGSVLDVLTQTKEQITRALRLETISALIISPFAGAAGYMMGYAFTGGDIHKIFSSATQVTIFIGTIAAFTILGYFSGRKLTREGYGKSLDEISRMIEQLKS